MSEQESRELKQYSSKGETSEAIEPPILAIDYGMRRIGIAVSDGRGLIASALDIVQITEKRGRIGAIEDIVEIARQHRVKGVLIGRPQAFEERHQEIQRSIEKFAKELYEKLPLPYRFYDESYSTSEAQNMLLSLGINRKSSKDKIDKVAAAIFLQQFLDNQNASKKS